MRKENDKLSNETRDDIKSKLEREKDAITKVKKLHDQIKGKVNESLENNHDINNSVLCDNLHNFIKEYVTDSDVHTICGKNSENNQTCTLSDW